jgi:hypothetical protein
MEEQQKRMLRNTQKSDDFRGLTTFETQVKFFLLFCKGSGGTKETGSSKERGRVLGERWR